ncbi:hypothetical protein GF323_05015 [Candidatus Woesearchaeota archaeon]|nr:hypothetical protein [Candidatus Woesearchaeota archaeon]
MKSTKASDSSKDLEKIVDEPIEDVSLVIVHVNEFYETNGCSVAKILEQRLAKNVYEHAAHNQSYLADHFSIGWGSSGNRYFNFEIDQIRYHIVDNETSPGNYDIENLQGSRLIMLGGYAGACHKKATDKAAQILYGLMQSGNIGELHLPADMIAGESEGYEGGDTWPDIIKNPSVLRSYEAVLKDLKKSYFVSFDRKVTSMDMSIDEPTIHLAIWSSSDQLVSYMRNHDRLKIDEVAR